MASHTKYLLLRHLSLLPPESNFQPRNLIFLVKAKVPESKQIAQASGELDSPVTCSCFYHPRKVTWPNTKFRGGKYTLPSHMENDMDTGRGKNWAINAICHTHLLCPTPEFPGQTQCMWTSSPRRPSLKLQSSYLL